ncbi:hypothetical protein HFC70_07970 [Agrobacterium sp. a22-2]|uniref:hypothetical protein n=1 Tax=Agrobacterium sp. a22-2 TaxID=2283840 RepID=UPI0014458271|nr:hypothetical protein [Agrobacterium sp. a22-2]NKN36294.1 hypothetical protein [Agrobacterium sp. a22-2]
MKILVTATLLSVLAASSAAMALEPIKGSITYNGHQSHLEKAPVGSNFFHNFTSEEGRNVREIYQVNADHSVSLVSRTVLDD